MIYRKLSIVAGILMIGITSFFSMYFSRAIVNHEKYSLLGVDVSSYQGEIDWNVIERQGIKFAFIKATEGSGMTDDYIRMNLENIADTDIYHSAYHFFSFDSPAETQADSFIKTVPKTENMLPPVIDVELYGKYLKSPPENTAEIKNQLKILISRLTEEYGMTPIIYTTGKSMRVILENDILGCDLWIRDILKKPDCDFVFWQYSSRGRLKGFDGSERYIDLNVFHGSAEEFSEYGR